MMYRCVYLLKNRHAHHQIILRIFFKKHDASNYYLRDIFQTKIFLSHLFLNYLIKKKSKKMTITNKLDVIEREKKKKSVLKSNFEAIKRLRKFEMESE